MNAEQRKRVFGMNKPLAHSLYSALILSGKFDVNKVARLLGCSPHTLYKWCEEKAIIPAWALAPLFLATRDIKLFSDLSGASALGLTVSEAPDTNPTQENIIFQMLGLGGVVGRLQEIIKKHLEDGVYTLSEEQEAIELINIIMSKLETLKKSIKKAV